MITKSEHYELQEVYESIKIDYSSKDGRVWIRRPSSSSSFNTLVVDLEEAKEVQEALGLMIKEIEKNNGTEE